MTRIHTSYPPKGTAIGIAFSGGLDTRTALLWLKNQGLDVYSYTANLAQPDEKDISQIPQLALEHGAKEARLLDCRFQLVQEGILAIQCGAFHIQSGGRKYFNTTPLGRAVTTVSIIRAMQEDSVAIFGDGSTHKGNDIQRFYRYGVLLNPSLEIYKPWLDEKFVKELGGRSEMSAYLESYAKPYTMSAGKSYSTDANLLGATHEAKHLEYLDKNTYLIDPIMGIPYWQEDLKIKTEQVKLEFKAGRPVAINDHSFDNELDLFLMANEIGGRHGLGMSDQIENRVIEAKSRGIYEAPGMSLLHICYERLLSTVHNESMLDLYYTEGRRLAHFLYEGRWYDPEALVLKDALSHWIAGPISGYVVLDLRRGDDYTIIETHASVSSYSPDELSMEKKTTAFSPGDRIGALSMQDLGLAANRKLLKHYLESNSKEDRHSRSHRGFTRDDDSAIQKALSEEYTD